MSRVLSPHPTPRQRAEGHTGRVALPGDPGWDEARQAWNLAVDQRPAAVLFPRDASDVAAAVRFARDAGLRVAVQSTGHMASSLGDLSGTALIRTTGMRGVAIDAGARRARVESGAIWEDVVAPATEHGLTALHGSAPDVGVAGYSLGGGIGWLARLHGLAASSITALELVTVDGEHARVDADHDPELFWGLRGGVANFGIVTALELELFPLERAYAGWLIWDWARSHEVLARWAEWTETAPETVTSIGRILRLPPIEAIPEPLRGRDLVVVEAAYVGDEESGRDLLRPLRELRPEMDTFAVVPARELTRLHRDPDGPAPGIGNGALVDALPPDAIAAYVEVAGLGSGSPLVSTELRHLGGAVGRPAPAGGALSHLDAGFASYSVGMAMDAESAGAAARRVALVNDTLAAWGSGRVFTNFSDARVDARSIFSPAAYDRLRALKRRMDPDGMLHASQEIPARADGE
jgi:FAD/FMN-containing dehydrogenase